MQLYRARPGGRRYYLAVWRLTVSVSGALGFVGAAVVALGLAGVGELRAGWFSLGAFAVLCTLLGAFSRASAAPLIAGAGWLVFDGFVAHRYGTVGWSGTGTESARYGLFAAAALATSLPVALPRRRIRVDSWPTPDREPTSGPPN